MDTTQATQDADARRAARKAAVDRAVSAVAALDSLDAESADKTDAELPKDFLDRTVAAEHEGTDALRDLVAVIGPRARSASGPRQTLEKADPADVAAFFASTGLTRKELAAAAGVSTSVIATVQNEKGDRWSLTTFEAKRALIGQWVIDHAAEIQTRKDADAAVLAAKDAAAAAEAQRASAKTTAAPKPTPAPKATATAPKAGRPSKAARAANRKAQPATTPQAASV